MSLWVLTERTDSHKKKRWPLPFVIYCTVRLHKWTKYARFTSGAFIEGCRCTFPSPSSEEPVVHVKPRHMTTKGATR